MAATEARMREQLHTCPYRLGQEVGVEAGSGVSVGSRLKLQLGTALGFSDWHCVHGKSPVGT